MIAANYPKGTAAHYAVQRKEEKKNAMVFSV